MKQYVLKNSKGPVLNKNETMSSVQKKPQRKNVFISVSSLSVPPSTTPVFFVSFTCAVRPTHFMLYYGVRSEPPTEFKNGCDQNPQPTSKIVN